MATVGVIATGLGISLITESTFERLRAAGEPLARVEGFTLHLSTGPQRVALTQLPALAIVSNETNRLGPCGELALRRRLLVARRDGLGAPDRELLDEHEVNGASAVTLVTPLAFAVIPDDAPLVEGLRAELQPYTADIGMILGGSVLSHLELVLDYPHARTLAQCGRGLAAGGCRVLPWCARKSEDNPSCR